MASRWLKIAALVLASTLVLGAAHAQTRLRPADEAQHGGRIGISTNTVWLPPAEGHAYLRRARDAGITWIREDFNWRAIEPRRGAFSWWRTDALMRNAAQRGIHVLAIATYAPAWASGHPESDKYPPTNPADYARFVGAVADRYARNGVFWRSHPRLTPTPITAIEIWNEPWLTEFWKPVPSAPAYARLVRAAATSVKSRHPGIQLLASADVPEESGGVGIDWFKSLLLADPTLWRSRLVNVWSVHLYCHELSPLDTTAPQRARFDRVFLTRSLAQEALADKPIWITEFGWKTDPADQDAVDEQTQAQYMREALERINTEWRSFVQRSFVFTWTRPSPGDQYNLVRPDGSARPAWGAIQTFITSGS